MIKCETSIEGGVISRFPQGRVPSLLLRNLVVEKLLNETGEGYADILVIIIKTPKPDARM